MNQKSIGLINPREFRMPNWLLKQSGLSVGAKFTFSVLACCAGGQDYVWPSQEFLAQKASVSVRTLQRYLDELVRCRLIEKAKKFIQGQTRNIYRFLTTSMADSPEPETQATEANQLRQGLGDHKMLISDRHDKLACRSLPAAKILPTETPDGPERHDNLSPLLNKDEAIKNYPPSPPPQESLTVAKVGSASSVSGKAGGVSLDSKTEDPDWTAVKDRLKGELGESSFQAWIVPLIFEKSGAGVILRCPNPFFKSWVKKEYFQALDKALTESGQPVWNLELLTEEQQKTYEQLQKRKQMENTGAAPTSERVDDADALEALPAEKLFEKVYSIYPRKERFERGLTVFLSLARQKTLPAVSELIIAIKRGLNGNSSWQREGGRFIPQIHNWLTERRWLD
jgi:hypothetical protein